MPFKIAQSGLNAALVGLRTTAHNIANTDTSGFRATRTVFSDITSGGVRANQLPRNTPLDGRESLEDSASDEAAASDVDLTEQLLNMLQYAQQIDAQVDTIRTADEAEQSVIDLVTDRRAD